MSDQLEKLYVMPYSVQNRSRRGIIFFTEINVPQFTSFGRAPHFELPFDDNDQKILSILNPEARYSIREILLIDDVQLVSLRPHFIWIIYNYNNYTASFYENHIQDILERHYNRHFTLSQDFDYDGFEFNFICAEVKTQIGEPVGGYIINIDKNDDGEIII